MGLLENLEKVLERSVNSAFARTFRSGLQPVEISAALKREIDSNAAVVSRNQILVPNNFNIRLATEDHGRMLKLGTNLTDELISVIKKHAATQGFQFSGPVIIRLEAAQQIATGVIEIRSSNGGKVEWQPTLEINNVQNPLRKARTIIGREVNCDIVIDDQRSSRQHLEIIWDGRNARARDLNSTNGTLLGGEKISTAILEPGSTLTIGATKLVFRVVPLTTAPPETHSNPTAIKADPANPASKEFWDL